MRLSDLAIKRPVTTLMLICIILVLGFVSFTRLNIDLFPEMNIPVSVISTSYSGAGPQEIESLVTRPLEAVMGTVSNVESISSTSSEGNSLIILQFADGTNMDFASQDIREKMDLVKPMLPDGVSDPMIFAFDPSMLPIMQLGITNSSGDLADLKTQVEEVIKPRLERIEGLASVTVTGGLERHISILTDPKKLQGYGLSLPQLVSALRMENMNLPGGSVSSGKLELIVRTTGEFQSLQDIENLPLVTPTGATLKLKDVAEVRDTYKDRSMFARMDGKESIGVSLQKQSTANTVRVSREIKKELDKLSKELPDLKIYQIMDQSEFIEQSIGSVGNNAIMGGLLAVIILYLFLRNFRSTIIIGVSIPISIIATFIMVYFSGLTLNLISLGGLALGVGMLVDNSIVVLENIYRHRQLGEDKMAAAGKGSAEVAMAITASTLTTVVVFLPIVFVEGFTGQIFKELALTVTFSLLASLGVALTLIPMFASKILSGSFVKETKFLNAVNKAYRRILGWALRRRTVTIAITLAAFISSILMAVSIGTEFLPNMDQGQFTVNMELPKGTRVEETDNLVKQVESILSEIPEKEEIFVSVGSGGMSILGTGSGNTASATVTLKPAGERNRSTSQIVEDVRKKVSELPGAKIEVQESSIMLGGSLSGDPVSVDIKGDDLNTLSSLANEVAKRISGVEGIREVKNNLAEGVPQMQIVVDRSRASSYGLNTATIASVVQAAISGQVATRYKVGGTELDVSVQIPEENRQSMEDVEDILIPTAMGSTVPLGDIARVVVEKGPASIERKDQTRVVTVTAALVGRDLGSAMKDVQKNMESLSLPQGYSISYGGMNEQLQSAIDDLTMALLLAVILVYMIMASQFESLIHPFTILFSIPLGFAGGLGLLFFTRKPLSVPAFIGLIILAGIVVNNAIVLVDYINQLRESGYGRDEAILEAGPTRLRPILMTTLTTVLGLIPLALGIGEGSEMEAPLAITVIGGLTLSTFLTLVVIPVIYTLFDDFGKKLRLLLKRG